ncbi:TlpA family protein disulfide reductase [Fluviibacterium sp. S390]|uniref:TlpA family protein disulfide reductase n=1 Tax=Fluviibacterium sp. S390 TaxID=3415139 RepID=UPI003C7ADAAC
MKSVILATLLALTPVLAQAETDLDSLNALRDGDMKKLVFHETPKPVSEQAFWDVDGSTLTLADFEGEIVLLNFWATWCAPCRKEMPGLNRIQAEMGDDGFRVVTLATGRNNPAGIDRFFSEYGITHLPRYTDPKQAVAREMSILGLPITVILNRDGQEIARLRGDAEWDSDSARAILTALKEAGAG